jgi:hypothetical protein
MHFLILSVRADHSTGDWSDGLALARWQDRSSIVETVRDMTKSQVGYTAV